MTLGEGDPLHSGVYVAFVDNCGFKYADRKLLMWHDGRWSFLQSDQRYRGHVYEWIGPLPTLELSDE